MWTFAFDAPARYDSTAGSLRRRRAPTPLARRKHFAIWLRVQLQAHDVPAQGPHAGEEGWSLSVNADDGFVFVLLGGDDGLAELRVDYTGAAEVEAEDVAQAVEAILTANPAVRIVEAA